MELSEKLKQASESISGDKRQGVANVIQLEEEPKLKSELRKNLYERLLKAAVIQHNITVFGKYPECEIPEDLKVYKEPNVTE